MDYEAEYASSLSLMKQLAIEFFLTEHFQWSPHRGKQRFPTRNSGESPPLVCSPPSRKGLRSYEEI